MTILKVTSFSVRYSPEKIGGLHFDSEMHFKRKEGRKEGRRYKRPA
jgi:hypothetical protein